MRAPRFEVTLVSPRGHEFRLLRLRTPGEVARTVDTATSLGYRVKRVRTVLSVERVWS